MPTPLIDHELSQQFRREGFVVRRGLFSTEEVQRYVEHFMALRAAGSHPGDMAGFDTAAGDPLLKFPRMIHMHRWDQASRDWLLDSRLRECLTTLVGVEPLAVQTMLYFKPPGARGQALHQDQFYLRVKPGECLAAWLALDRCDEENGCMQMVPGSHKLPLLCTEAADTSISFTDTTVPLAPGAEPVPVRLEPGDVLFFGGMMIHGSFPNSSKTRFRRSLIGHYITELAEMVADYYHPVLRFDGTEVNLGDSPQGGPCGVWVDRAGKPMVELQQD